jgi:hypothetical protein
MYFLKQRPDFQKKFNMPAEGEQEEGEGEDNKPWRRKQQAQLDAEVAERAAQLAAAAQQPVPAACTSSS